MNINIDELKRYLEIDRNSLDNELTSQPSIFYRVGEACVDANDRRDALKEALALTEAEIENDIRETAEKHNEKITNDEVKSRVKIDPDRKKAYAAFAQAKRDADKLTALKESFSQRASMLKHLCELYVANYYETKSIQGTSRQDLGVYVQQRNKISEHRRNGR